MSHDQSQKGFTLVEMLVATALFAVVMTVSVSSLLALIDANRKAQSLQSVMANLSVSIDGMVRAMRMGTTYHCGTGSLSTVRDCTVGDTQVAFEPFGGSSSTVNDQWVYFYNSSDKRIYKSENGGTSSFAITAPEVEIDNMTFYVTDTSRSDNQQARILMVIEGTAGTKAKTRTNFSIQAMATQRLLDI